MWSSRKNEVSWAVSTMLLHVGIYGKYCEEQVWRIGRWRHTIEDTVHTRGLLAQLQIHVL